MKSFILKSRFLFFVESEKVFYQMSDHRGVYESNDTILAFLFAYASRLLSKSIRLSMSMDDIFADKLLDFQIRGTFICGPWWIWLSILTFS